MTMKTYPRDPRRPRWREPRGHSRLATDVQAGDAARPLMAEGEAILSIGKGVTAGPDPVDAGPPVSQAAELAPVTPGAAAAPAPETWGATQDSRDPV
jgi:hypothetical protein